MTSILAFEKKIEALLKYSTPIGHLNHAVLFFGRFCTINLLIALHSDDMREFKCDVITVGCVQLCNNRFNPLSHIRFFNMQVNIKTLIAWPLTRWLSLCQLAQNFKYYLELIQKLNPVSHVESCQKPYHLYFWRSKNEFYLVSGTIELKSFCEIIFNDLIGFDIRFTQL